jgi:antitoxin component YwqK of YwqJK toxin-antitoxin module
MRTSRNALRLVLLLIATASCAQKKPQQMEKTDAELDGLAGPVRTVSTESQNFDARWHQPDGPSLLLPIFCRVCEYDPDGVKTRSGQMLDGRFAGDVIQVDRNHDGKVTSLRFFNGNGDLYREDQCGPLGVTERTGYTEGKLSSRQTFTYDQYGHLSGVISYDKNGDEVDRFRTVTNKDGVVIEQSTWGKNGKLTSQATYNPETTVDQFTAFDESGKVTLKRTSVDSHVKSFWEAESSERRYGDSFYEPKGENDIDQWSCRGQKCDLFHIHFEYLDPNKRNPKSAEWRDSAGKVLFAAYYEYTMDASRNWTGRKITVLTPELTAPALYEEDSRAILYWPQ